jgi:carbonic anhydrase/acetyltransferase-like protein (isoleucine patch superfamily)
MAVYALGSQEPQIHPDAYVHPDAVIIGDVRLAAGASVWPGDLGAGRLGAALLS